MTDFDLLAWLDGASAWWWIAFAVALGAAEMATFTYVLLWLALAALGPGLALFVAPGLSGMAQLTIFAGLSMTFLVGGRLWFKRHPPAPAEGPALNRRAEQLVGRNARAFAAFENGEGVVLVDDVRWRARLEAGAAEVGADQSLTVVGAEGMTLICAPR